MKLAVIITSDPKADDDGLGRAFQGMAPAAGGVPRLEHHALPGTRSVASLRRCLAEGWQTMGR